MQTSLHITFHLRRARASHTTNRGRLTAPRLEFRPRRTRRQVMQQSRHQLRGRSGRPIIQPPVTGESRPPPTLHMVVLLIPSWLQRLLTSTLQPRQPRRPSADPQRQLPVLSPLNHMDPGLTAMVMSILPMRHLSLHDSKRSGSLRNHNSSTTATFARSHAQVGYDLIGKEFGFQPVFSGPQTYQEHLEGQKHKKKLAAAAAASASPVTSVTSPSGAMQHQGGFQSGGGQGGGPHRGGPRVGNALRCELCDVTCTGSDAYAAHIRGSKHQKVIKLHTKLGKPIPSVNPVIVNSSKVGPPVANNNGNLGEDSSSSQSNPQAAKKPRINIVRKEANDKTIGVSMSNGNNGGNTNKNNSSNGGCPEVVNIPLLPDEKVVQPVGSDYIEEVRSEDGSKILSFFCKLCECKFNDPNAKEMHMKGRRHRLQYKKKVNPNLVVDLKPSLRQRKLQEERAKRSMAKEDFWRRRDEEFRAMEEEERNMMWMNGPPPPGGPYPVPPHHPHPGAMMMRRPDSSDDRHVMAKHTTIYPTEDSLALIQKQVAFVERGLKMVSDEMAATGEASATGSSEPTGKSKTNGADETSEAHPTSKLKGVMRVGPLAKGLLLRADSKVDLVLLCSEVPTKSLLKEVSSKLTKHLETVTKSDDGVKFVVKENTKEASVEVVSDSITVSVGLTSPLVRNSNNDEFTSDGDVKPSDKEDNNVLDRDKCIEFLAHVRHAKWFTARAASLQSCVMVLRVLRDLVSWSPSWQPLPAFALELIAEKTLASAGLPMSPGDALRRILESLAGGLLLPGIRKITA